MSSRVALRTLLGLSPAPFGPPALYAVAAEDDAVSRHAAVPHA
jgi:hypothetical protein